MTRRSSFLLGLCLSLAASASVAGNSWLFVDARLITLLDDEVRGGEVLVRDGEIVAVGDEVPPAEAAAATVIDVDGGYLLPGLAEMHAHVPSSTPSRQYRDDVLFLFLARGVTTIRGMLGEASHLELKAELQAGRVAGPRLFTSGPSFNGNTVSSPTQGAERVRDQAIAGYDFIKIHPGLTRAEYDAIAAAAREVRIPFAGHVPAAVGLEGALASGQASIDHLDGYVQALVPDLAEPDARLFAPELLPRVEPGRIDELVRLTREAGTWVVPTETLLENFARVGDAGALAARPQNRYLPPALRERYADALAGVPVPGADDYLALRKRLILALHNGGVGLLLGSDAPQIYNVPGFSTHRELASLVAAGLTPLQALRTATVNPARYFNREEVFGMIAPGMAADLLWVAENPLDDIGHLRDVRGVMARGRWYDHQTLETGLSEIASRYASQ